jgi:ABC-type nitrate/sulfonate/bicarbonate transport system substrate-binding protein
VCYRANAAPRYIARNQGLCKEERIENEPKAAQDSSELVTSLVADNSQVAFLGTGR